MYRIINITDKNGNPKTDFVDKLKKDHPLLEGEILNKSLLQNDIFLDSLEFRWNDNSRKILLTSYVTKCEVIAGKVIVRTANSIYTLEPVGEKQ